MSSYDRYQLPGATRPQAERRSRDRQRRRGRLPRRPLGRLRRRRPRTRATRTRSGRATSTRRATARGAPGSATPDRRRLLRPGDTGPHARLAARLRVGLRALQGERAEDRRHRRPAGHPEQRRRHHRQPDGRQPDTGRLRPLTVQPQPNPPTSTINFPLGDNRGNNLTSPLGRRRPSASSTRPPPARPPTSSSTSRATSSTTTTATYKTLSPVRVLDTRRVGHRPQPTPSPPTPTASSRSRASSASRPVRSP